MPAFPLQFGFPAYHAQLGFVITLAVTLGSTRVFTLHGSPASCPTEADVLIAG